MKLVEAELRIGLQKVADRDRPARIAKQDSPDPAQPNWRLLKVDGLKPSRLSQ